MAPGNHVLVVDDNLTVRRFVSGVLRPMGYKVHTASDGMEALGKAAQFPMDLILLDLVMPRMNGYHFCKALEQKKLAEDARIVLLTSAKEHVAAKVKQTTRVEETLQKPIKTQQLRLLVEKYLPLDATEAEEEDSFEFDTDEFDASTGQGLPAIGEQDTSDDSITNHRDLTNILRDKLDSEVANGLAAHLDEIVNAKNGDEVLTLIAEVLASIINDELIERLISLARTKPQKDSASDTDFI